MHSAIEPPHICDFHGCGKTFGRRYNLKCHRRIHTNETPYQCDKCDKEFKWKSSLNHHQKSKLHNQPQDRIQKKKTIFPESQRNRISSNRQGNARYHSSFGFSKGAKDATGTTERQSVDDATFLFSQKESKKGWAPMLSPQTESHSFRSLNFQPYLIPKEETFVAMADQHALENEKYLDISHQFGLKGQASLQKESFLRYPAQSPATETAQYSFSFLNGLFASLGAEDISKLSPESTTENSAYLKNKAKKDRAGNNLKVEAHLVDSLGFFKQAENEKVPDEKSCSPTYSQTTPQLAAETPEICLLNPVTKGALLSTQIKLEESETMFAEKYPMPVQEADAQTYSLSANHCSLRSQGGQGSASGASAHLAAQESYEFFYDAEDFLSPISSNSSSYSNIAAEEGNEEYKAIQDVSASFSCDNTQSESFQCGSLPAEMHSLSFDEFRGPSTALQDTLREEVESSTFVQPF